MAEARKYKANREDWGTIRERNNGRFQASYMHEGNRYYAPITFSTRTDARGWLAAQRSDIQRGTWRNPKAAAAESFGAYAHTWVTQRVTSKGQPLRPKTRAEYERQLQKGLSDFSDDRLTAITAARVRSWHVNRMKAGKTAAAAEARLLRAIMNDAILDGIITANPVPQKLTKTSAGKSYRPPTPDELAVLHDRVEDRFKLGVLLAAYGGLRLSEWRALRRSDLVLLDGRYTLTITRQAQHLTGQGWITGPPKSKRGIRPISLPKWMTTVIDMHIAEHVGAFPESLLFAPKGRSEFIHDSDFNKTWVHAQDAAGVRGVVREHDLRGFASSHLVQTAGGSLIEARDFLGHSQVRTTETHYLHVVNDRAAELADRMPPLPKADAANVANLLPGTGIGRR